MQSKTLDRFIMIAGFVTFIQSLIKFSISSNGNNKRFKRFQTIVNEMFKSDKIN